MEQTFADHYRELNDDALLRIASDRHDLTPEAAQALDSEMSIRHLSTKQVKTIVEEDRKFDKHQALSDAASTSGFRGTGTGFFGCWNVEQTHGMETYTATKFIMLVYFPLIPLGTFRLMRNPRQRWFKRLGGREFRVVEALPLDWNQVLWSWGKAAAFIFVLLLVIRLLVLFSR